MLILELKVLGSPSLVRSDGSQVDLGAKQLALLTYLGIEGSDRTVSRDKLLAMFWPESDQKQARNSLNQTLHELRGIVGEEFLISHSDTSISVQIDAIRVDVVEFQDEIRQRRHERALSLYHGPFLDGFHLVGCHEFNDWMESKREVFRVAAKDTAAAVAEIYLSKGHIADALEPLRTATELDPYDEAQFAVYVHALVADGRRGEATRAYDRFSSRLREDLGIEPSDSIRRTLSEPAGDFDLKAIRSAPPQASSKNAPSFTSRNRGVAYGIAAAVVLIALVGFAQLFPFRQQTTSASGRRITDDGRILEASISPDGRFVAFLSGYEKTWPQTLSVKEIGSDPEIELFRGLRLHNVAWSRDNEVMFNGTGDLAQRERRRAIPLLGGDAADVGRALPFSPSREGDVVQWFSNQNILLSGLDTLRIPFDSIWIVGAERSPDGSRYAVTFEKRGIYQLLVLSITGEEMYKPLRHSGPLGAPTWEPDGTGLYVLRDSPNGWDLIKTPASIREPVNAIELRPLARRLEVFSSPSYLARVSVSDDGRNLVFVRRVSARNLFRIALGTGDSLASPTRLTSGSQEYRFPRISPSGAQVAVVRTTATGSDIYTLDLQTGETRQRTFGSWQLWYPAWSSDGSRLAFGSSESDSNTIKILELETDQLSTLSGVDWGTEREIVWSPEGSLFYNENGDRNYREYDLATANEAEFIPEEFGWVYQPRLDGSGSMLASYVNVPIPLQDRFGPPGVYVFDTMTGAHNRIVDGYFWYPIGWEPDGRTLLVMRAGTRDLYRVEIASGDRVFVLTFPFDIETDQLGLAPLGDFLIAAVDESISDAYMMEGFDSKYR